MHNFVHRSLLESPVRRIAKEDSNYFVLMLDPERDKIDPVCVVEVFTVGGRTPPNTHRYAHEFFFVLSGEGRADCEGASRAIVKGDVLMLRPGAEHVIENTGDAKLYTLTVMAPNEGFAELIRAGHPVELDDEDIATLTSTFPRGVGE